MQHTPSSSTKYNIMSPGKFIIVLLILCITSQTYELSEGQKEKLQSFVRATMECRSIVGMSVALVRKGETVFTEGFGYRDADKDLPLTADTKINLGSISKSVTSTVAAEAVSRGFIDWDTPIKDILGQDFRMQDDFSTEFGSLRDLFTHRVGIRTYWGVSTAALNISREELVMKRFQHFDRFLEFRQRHNYANYLYVVGAHAVEKATGELWEEATARLFNELGMTNSTTSARMKLEDWDNTAFSYIVEDGKNVANPEIDQKQFLDEIGPTAGIFSTANDMAKWLKFHLAEGINEDGSRLISAEAMNAQKFPTSAYSRGSTKNQRPKFPVDDIQFAYGLGFHLGQYRGYEKFYHTGSYSSYSCRMAMLPEADVGVWSCVNSPGDYRGTRANHAFIMYALDVLLEVAECPPVRGAGICLLRCTSDTQCRGGRKCCSNGCGQDCITSVESWLNETTSCTYPDPWRSAARAGDTGDDWQDDAEDFGTSQRSPIPNNLFHPPSEQDIGKPGPTIKRELSEYEGSYGHLAFGIYYVYMGTENLRYEFGALLKGDLIPSGTEDEFHMTVEYPISYRMSFYPQYPDGFPVYFSGNTTEIDKVSVPYLEFDQPPVFEKGVTPPIFP